MMSPKLYSFFLFMFLANSFHISYSRTQRATDPTNSSSVTTVPSHEESQNFKSDETEGKGLIFASNNVSNLILIYNNTGDAGLFLDLNNSLIAMGNGYILTAVIVDVKDRKGAYVSNNRPKLRKQSLNVFLAAFKHGIQADPKRAIKFELDNPPSKVINAVNTGLEKLVDNISEELERNPKVGFKFFLAVGSELLRLHQGPLSGYTTILGNKGINTGYDLVKSYNIQNGLAAIYGKVPGGILALLRAGAKIKSDFNKITKAENGIEVLAIVIDELGSVTDAGDILGDLVNDPHPFFKLVNLLGGNSGKGVSGVLKVVATIIEFIKKDTSLENLINVIVQFLAVNSQNDPKEISNALKQSVSLLIKAITKADCTDTLPGAIKVAKSLAEGSLKISGVRVSAIASRLISAISNPKKLQVLVKVLLELNNSIGIEESLPRLLLVLILNVNSPLGIQLLQGLGIAVDNNLRAVSGSVIKYILRSAPDAVDRLSQNLYEGLRSLPDIKRIATSLESAISECGVKKSLKELLKNHEDADLIKAVFHVVGGLNLELPEDVLSRARQTVDECASVNFYLNVNTNIVTAIE